MILVADAGSTKTSWAFISSAGIQIFQTAGIHALLHNEENIKKVLNEVCNFNTEINISSQVKALYFFGTGCHSKQASDRLYNLFKPYFPVSSLQFKSDMEAACLASSSNQDSWVFILGTGSNSCIWKNNSILAQVPSGGFILGDEGSGVSLGKKILTAWLRKTLPNDLQELFKNTFDLTYDELLNNLYRNNSPNTYLASFVPFIHQHRHHPYIHELIITSFSELMYNHKTYLLSSGFTIPNRLGFVGSIAYYFSEELNTVFAKHCSLIQIVHRPIEKLVEYYQHQLSNA